MTYCLLIKNENIAWYLVAEEQSFYYMQCFSSSRCSDFSRNCYTALQFRQTGSIWCFVNLKIRHKKLFSIPMRETDKGAQKMMQRNRQIPETVYSIWMTSLPDHLGSNEHYSNTIIYTITLIILLLVCFLWQYYYFCNYKQSRLLIPNMHIGKM